VTGPDGAAAPVLRELVDRQMPPPAEADFPVVQPGGTWSHTCPGFPAFGGALYTLGKPGAYRIKATYSNPADALRGNPLAAGCWLGTLGSNEAVLTVEPFVEGAAVEGIQVRLAAERAAWAVGRVPTLKLEVANGGRRQLSLAIPLSMACVLEADGKTYRWMGVVHRGGRVPFPPGEKREATLRLDQTWRTADKGQPLRLPAGKHVVRVAVTAMPARGTEGGAVTATSKPVEIAIGPAAPAARPRDGA